MDERIILFVSPSTDFGKLVYDSITHNEAGRVKTSSSIKEVVDFANNNKQLDFAFLDLEMGIEKVTDCMNLLRDKYAFIKLILISKENPSIVAAHLEPWIWLKKPFMEDDLLKLLGNPMTFYQSEVIEGEFRDTESSGMPAWAENKEALQANLVGALNNVDVERAFVYCKQGVIARTNDIQDIDINEIPWHLYRTDNNFNKGEIIKPVTLSSGRYILHGMVLVVGVILAILYDESIPVKIARNQTLYIVTKITQPQLEKNSKLALPERFIQKEDEPVPAITMASVEDKPNRTVKLQVHMARKFKRASAMDIEQTQLNPLTSKPKDEEKVNYYQMDEGTDYKDPGLKSSNEPAKGDAGIRRITESTNLPDMSVEKKIHYSCALIPRIKSTPIVNDLAGILNDEIPNIFLAYGWKLEKLLISRDYMEWTAYLPANISLSDHIQIVRQMSSKIVLNNFTRFSRDGLITDFWAPGYMLEAGSEPIPLADIQKFILSNREEYYPDPRVYKVNEQYYEQHL